MFGYDNDETQLVLKLFYNRRNEQGLESYGELTKLLPLAMQADRNSELRVCGCVAIKTQNQGLSLNN